MRRIGITGQSGFIGSYLYIFLGLQPGKFERIFFDKTYFENPELMDAFVHSCDTIVHLAAMNRNPDPEIIYQTNIALNKKLIDSLYRTQSKAHVIFASSIQEQNENEYGRSKKDGRQQFIDWANLSGGSFTGLIIPNVFGPFGQPYHNSVIATFCNQLTHNEIPVIKVDAILKLMYVGELVNRISKIAEDRVADEELEINHTAEIQVSEILKLLQQYKSLYIEAGVIPPVRDTFELNLFNTFRCYIDHRQIYPTHFTKHTDERGTFSEIVKLNMGGQVSFSTTLPGMTRGNHFHTRKIERFAVIKGKALIQLRRIGSDEVMDFYLDGNEPAYVDMPIWYTHNIKNIGSEELYTVFWINELYNNDDPDTFYEAV